MEQRAAVGEHPCSRAGRQPSARCAPRQACAPALRARAPTVAGAGGPWRAAQSSPKISATPRRRRKQSPVARSEGAGCPRTLRPGYGADVRARRGALALKFSLCDPLTPQTACRVPSRRQRRPTGDPNGSPIRAPRPARHAARTSTCCNGGITVGTAGG